MNLPFDRRTINIIILILTLMLIRQFITYNIIMYIRF